MLKLIKEYKEGLKIYYCSCKHRVSKPKFIKEKDFSCPYCGAKIVKDNPLPIIYES